MLNPIRTNRYTVITAPKKRDENTLSFRRITLEDIPVIRPYLPAALSRTCDFTIGGLFMWTDYFNYSYAILNHTLFIKGVTEDDVTRPAFSLPIGRMDIEESVEILREYCRNNSIPLIFSAVPDAYVGLLSVLGAKEITPLLDWSDYLYDASSLASLTGKKFNKKRNHVNRFTADHPDYSFGPITSTNLPAIKEFFIATHLPLSKPVLADIEREQVIRVLDNIDRYPFIGGVLSTPENGIVAFTLGEVIGDTLYVHIEKMNHLVTGAGETINKLFAEMTLHAYPSVRYINREEDVGDPGLRHAKESYHPSLMLSKYNVTMWPNHSHA